MIRTSKASFTFYYISFFHPLSALSHDGWVEIKSDDRRKRQVANPRPHSRQPLQTSIKSYRIAGKWDGKNTTLAVVNPGGKTNYAHGSHSSIWVKTKKRSVPRTQRFLPRFVYSKMMKAFTRR